MTVTGGFPSPRPVTRSFDVFFDLRLNKRLSKQFETPSRLFWRHCNVLFFVLYRMSGKKWKRGPRWLKMLGMERKAVASWWRTGLGSLAVLLVFLALTETITIPLLDRSSAYDTGERRAAYLWVAKSLESPFRRFRIHWNGNVFIFFFHNFRHRLHRKFVEVTTFVAASGEISSKWHFRFGFTVNCVPKIHWSTTAWWRHQMETFSALLALCAGNLPVPGEFPSQRPVTRNFDIFFELCPNKRLSKQWWGWWFETQSHSLWRHCNGWSEFPHTESAIQCLKYVSLSFAWTVIIYVRTVNGQWHKIVGIRNNTIKGKCRLCSMLISKLDISLLSLDIAPSQGQAKFLDDLSCLAQFPFEFPCLISQKLQWKWINTPIFRKKNLVPQKHLLSCPNNAVNFIMPSGMFIVRSMCYDEGAIFTS